MYSRQGKYECFLLRKKVNFGMYISPTLKDLLMSFDGDFLPNKAGYTGQDSVSGNIDQSINEYRPIPCSMLLALY